MLGTSPEQLAFQEQQLGTTLRKSQWWIKDVSEYLKEKQLREDTKPPKAVLESAILMTWKNTPAKEKNREDIREAVRTKMKKGGDEGWGKLYPEWFYGHIDYMSTFEVAVDNRVKVMISRGILERVELGRAGITKYQLGTYQLARTLSKDEWDTITGVDKLPAQKGLVIPTLLDLK